MKMHLIMSEINLKESVQDLEERWGCKECRSNWWCRDQITNKNPSKPKEFLFCLSISSNKVRLLLGWAATKKLKVLLFVKLREAILTLITSWGTHELVSLSLEMELWQRPPITAINVLKFCSWWSFCVDIKKSQYNLKVHVVQCAPPNFNFLYCLALKSYKFVPFDFMYLVMSCDFTGCNMNLFYCY